MQFLRIVGFSLIIDVWTKLLAGHPRVQEDNVALNKPLECLGAGTALEQGISDERSKRRPKKIVDDSPGVFTTMF
ncbi:hypothetical protein NC653_034299 [Populus alba x Populus x berolinensis]|uniref:Uncharacterized protein n=1 Tax=Populus alba x Populus x berolinensis TaxID=444605 RepID=A0AAD6PXM3_9ROSI|nr:hypothetical protein NC653_034299 [Populus alba x Populus x berolinensis]